MKLYYWLRIAHLNYLQTRINHGGSKYRSKVIWKQTKDLRFFFLLPYRGDGAKIKAYLSPLVALGITAWDCAKIDKQTLSCIIINCLNCSASSYLIIYWIPKYQYSAT